MRIRMRWRRWRPDADTRAAPPRWSERVGQAVDHGDRSMNDACVLDQLELAG